MKTLAPGDFRSVRAAVGCGLAAGFCWFTGIALAAWAFDRSNVIPYAPWNHTISELGFPAASSLAWLHNASEVAVAVLLWPTYRALDLSLSTPAAKIGAWLGRVVCLALIGLGAQGLYTAWLDRSYRPLVFLELHNDFSAVFFLGWLGMVVVFTGVFLLRGAGVCRLVTSAGFLAVLIFAAGLWAAFRADPMGVALARDLKDPTFGHQAHQLVSTAFFGPWFDSHRPARWSVAALEWGIASSFILWHGAALLYLWRQTRPTLRSPQEA